MTPPQAVLAVDHHADNDPNNKNDPTGLRPGDGQFVATQVMGTSITRGGCREALYCSITVSGPGLSPGLISYIGSIEDTGGGFSINGRCRPE